MMIAVKSFPIHPLFLATTLTSLLSLTSSAFATDLNDSQTTFLDQLIINASLISQTTKDSESSITTINDDQLIKENATTIGDVFRYTPSVSVSGGAQGDGLITIRGISGNRVLIAVDGVKQAKNLSWGSLNSSRNLIDIETIKQVEVIPGPASASFGSDALGGLVYYTTKDPSDFLQAATSHEGNLAGQYRAIYNGSDKGITNSISVAGQQGNTEGLVILSYRDAEETQTPISDSTTGSERRSTDPKEAQDKSVLAKLNVKLSPNQTLKFTGEQLNSTDDTLVLSSNSQDENFLDIERRQRLSAEYINETDSSLAQQISLKASWQKTTNDQTQSLYNANAPYFGDYVYDADYDETSQTIQLRLQKDLDLTNTTHQVSYGLSYDKTLFEQQRTSSLSGTNRSMPRAESSLAGIWVQDLIEWQKSGLRLTPGVRYDAYAVEAQPDATYLASNPLEANPGKNTDQHLSFKLGANYPLNDQVTWFGQFSQGFKTPDMDQLFANYGRAGAYQFIANADLKPETSNSLETGLRFSDDGVSSEIAIFYNDYDNFIDETVSYGDSNYPYGVYQQTNLQGVVIKGIELKTELNFGEWNDSIKGLSITGAIAYAKGTSEESGSSEPMDSVSPLSGVMSLNYNAPNQHWGSSLILTGAKGKAAGDTSDSSTFRPAGYGVVDLTGYYQWNPNLRIDAGVYNLSDKTYWEWDTARNYTQSTQGLERFAESGRHLRLGLTYAF